MLKFPWKVFFFFVFLCTGYCFLLAQTELLTKEEWKIQREECRQIWLDALGKPTNNEFSPHIERLEQFSNEEFEAELLLQQNSPTTQQKMLLLKPPNRKGRVPGFVVPYYDPDRMCGYDLQTKKRLPPGREYAEFGRLLVRKGYVVLCVEAYPYNIFEETPAQPERGLGLWKQAAQKLNTDHPQWSGMGKLVTDVRLAVDYLSGLDCVDPQRLGIAGHSLGGKMAFYAGCLDERISLIWASDFGMRWEDTNWTDPWYWGKEKVAEFQKRRMDHSSLLSLHAPGMFILIAGEVDGIQTTPLLERAQEICQIFGKEERVVFFNHASGHQPTQETVEAALEEIAKFFHTEVL